MNVTGPDTGRPVYPMATWETTTLERLERQFAEARDLARTRDGAGALTTQALETVVKALGELRRNGLWSVPA